MIAYVNMGMCVGHNDFYIYYCKASRNNKYATALLKEHAAFF